MSLSIRVDIPDEMRRKGRSSDPVFSLQENLYIRFRKMLGKTVNPSNIKYDGQSVNRSKYSKPQWVLYPIYLHWGYGSFKVKDIPDDIKTPDNKIIEFRTLHEPVEENYSHSAIYPFKSGVRYKQLKNKPDTKMEFRIKLSQRIGILKYPNGQLS